MPDVDIKQGEYTDIDYLQFTARGPFRRAQAVAGVLTWPLIWPLAMLCRKSEMLFRTVSELLSVVPYLFGTIMRYEFYRFSLRQCGQNVLFEFGSILIQPDISIGHNVLIGRYSIIHHCDFGDFVLVGERCTFLSGSKQHNFASTDAPMALQGGKKKRICVGNDTWIGSHAVVMDDVGTGVIVGAGAIVTKPVDDRQIVLGNPARSVGERKHRSDERRSETVSTVAQ